MLIVLGSVTVKPEGCAEALELSLRHVARSRTEAGCIAHSVHVDAENPNRLVFVEQWSDADALQAHFRLPASRAFVKGLAGLAAAAAPGMAVFSAAQIQV